MIMNNLQKYKQSLLKESRKENADDAIESGMSTGFDAVLALDLPVKFHKWTQETEETGTAYLTDDDMWAVHFDQPTSMTTAGLYQYWIENVFKPE